MDTSKDVCTYYTILWRENNYGDSIIETSLRKLMRNCPKFIEEDKQLQTNACNMWERRNHILINFTPKCHPKISGEVIEYSWGYTKDYHRRLSFYKKKIKKKIQIRYPRGHIKIKPYHKVGLYFFYTCMVIYHCIKTDEPQANSCGPLNWPLH